MTDTAGTLADTGAATVFDADNHYYEALDAFTRHLDPRLGSRCVQWAEINGRRYHVVGGRAATRSSTRRSIRWRGQARSPTTSVATRKVDGPRST